MKPHIIGHPEETVEFYIGSFEKGLNCTASGEPRPNRIIWHKDNDTVKLMDEVS